MLSYIIKMYSDRKRENIFYSGHKDEKKNVEYWFIDDVAFSR